MDYHEHDIGVSDAWKPVAKKEMVNVNVMAMRKNLNSFSLLLTEQVVKEPAVVEEEEQLVLADLRVMIVGTQQSPQRWQWSWCTLYIGGQVTFTKGFWVIDKSLRIYIGGFCSEGY